MGVKNSKTLLALVKNDDVSDFLKKFIYLIEQSALRREELGNVLINQYMVFKDDSRYRWKINYKLNNYSAGLIAERDPNETELLDHISGYVIKKYDSAELLIGDYQIVVGFGMWSWRSVSTRKSFESIAGLPRMGRGISPYRSSNEAWYLRGIGFTKSTNLGDWLISLGYTNQDGRIDSLEKVPYLHVCFCPHPLQDVSCSDVSFSWCHQLLYRHYRARIAEVRTGLSDSPWEDQDKSSSFSRIC